MSLILLVSCYVFLVIPAVIMTLLLLMVPVAVMGSGVLILLLSYSNYVARVEREFQNPTCEFLDLEFKKAS